MTIASLATVAARVDAQDSGSSLPAAGDWVNGPGDEPAWLADEPTTSLSRLPSTEQMWLDVEQQDAIDSDERALGGDFGGGDRAPFKSRLTWIPTQDLKNSPGHLSLNSQEMNLAFPLRIDDDGIWLATGGLQRLEVNTTATLPDAARPFPTQLWDVEIGLMRIRKWDDGRSAGGMVRVGSPSDRPFAAVRDMTVTFLGFLTVPSGEHDAWSFSLFYSPTGQVAFPIPGVAYQWRPSPEFSANLGIPFSFEYRPTETLTLTGSYMPVTNVKFAATQKLGVAWNVHAGYETVTEAFLLADRDRDRERTYIFDQRVTLGLQRELS
ncbi:MAG TPA: hypothetical protein PLV92_09985, partial [Pirellulaceae bacterium]|nr:hypothetical protein [Pirellulaceae bacterium]